MIKFEAHDKPIKEILFSHDQFRIPEYQRPYSRWVDEATDFWNDMLESDNWYFIWSFVLNYEEEIKTKRVDIIDWQQRSLTITIFLAGIRDYLQRTWEKEKAEQIQQKYIAEHDAFKKTTEHRIFCWESTRDFFETYIQNWENAITEEEIKKSDLTKEAKQILDVYLFFKRKIEEITEWLSHEKKIEEIIRLIDKIMELRAIRIKIESESDAYTIFETVNARGADLTVSDLVKNLIFRHYDKNLNKLWEAKKIWSEIENNINDSWMDISKFLRHYRLSKYNYISEKELFKEIKKKIHNYEHFLNEIAEQSYYYKIILNPKYFDENDLELPILKWRETDPFHIFNAIKWISILKIKQFAPIFLSLFRNYKKLVKAASPRSLIENIEKFWFSFFWICSSPARTIEKEWSRFAIEIEKNCKWDYSEKEFQNSIQSIYNNYKEFLKKNQPGFDKFREWFDDLSYKKGPLVKYILIKISNDIEKENSQDDLFDYDKVNIEHIFPKEPKQRWFKKSEVSWYVDKIWNLTLLWKRMNSWIWNSILEEKTENEKWFKASPITMNKILVEYFRKNNYKWDEEEINKRHEEICKEIYRLQKIT